MFVDFKLQRRPEPRPTCSICREFCGPDHIRANKFTQICLKCFEGMASAMGYVKVPFAEKPAKPILGSGDYERIKAAFAGDACMSMTGFKRALGLDAETEALVEAISELPFLDLEPIANGYRVHFKGES